MKIVYDAEADSLYISLSDDPRVKQLLINDKTIFDLSDDGRVLGIEILGATVKYGSGILNLDCSQLEDFSQPCVSAYIN